MWSATSLAFHQPNNLDDGEGQITRNLKNILNSYPQAKLIAQESTVRNPSKPQEYFLPYGFVQSPLIASICLHKSALGKYLHAISKLPYTISVYMDDILISTNLPVEDAEAIFYQLRLKAERSGFPLNSDKTFAPRAQLEIFNISATEGSIEILPERMMAFQKKLQNAKSSNEIAGVLRYIKQINDQQFKSFLDFAEPKEEGNQTNNLSLSL